MDAYDIFKQLTRGAKFNNKKQTEKSKQVKSETELTIKQETEDKDDAAKETDTNKVKATGRFKENAITLLSSLHDGVISTKQKKRGIDEDTTDNTKKRLCLEQEKINQFRNQHNINVVGRHVPNPVASFNELSVGSDLLENVKSCGYTNPTPIQMQAIPIMLQGRQLLACAPTGSGKTAAFLLPILNLLEGPQNKGFRALIICPTRELAKQTRRECVRLSANRGFRIHVISKIKQALTQYQSKSSKKYDILVTTPNRLCFLLKQDPPVLSLENVKWLVIDEADKLFETGVRSFREQLEQVIQNCTDKDRKIAMFSATYTPAIAKWCVHNMRGLIRVTVGQRNAATDLVDQKLLFVGDESGKLLAFRNLVREGLHPPVLVFVQSKERAQQLFNELIYDGINVDAIHADRTQLQRDNTVKSFREGRIWVLICTELMARGLDFKGVNLVVNYDFPPSAIAYIHRIGRAGRAGRTGKAITFFTKEDTVNLRSIAHVLKQSGCEVPDYMLSMKKRSKKERKKLQTSAPPRDDITTRPVYEMELKNRKRRRKTIKSTTPSNATKTNKKKVKGKNTVPRKKLKSKAV